MILEDASFPDLHLIIVGSKNARAVYHKVCGGKVEYMDMSYHWTPDVLKCRACKLEWDTMMVEAWQPYQIAETFQVQGDDIVKLCLQSGTKRNPSYFYTRPATKEEREHYRNNPPDFSKLK